MTTTHTTAGREQWLAARIELLEAEKELTRHSDEVARQRQALPWVPVEQDYRDRRRRRVTTRPVRWTLAAARLPLHVRTSVRGWLPVMFGDRRWLQRLAVHLENHDVAISAVSRAPIATLPAYKRRMGWTFPWASSQDSNFNYDFSASFTEDEQRSGTIDYNYRPRDTTYLRAGQGSVHAAMCGTDAATYGREQPGMSAFALDDGVVYHTYSTYARGLDGLWGMYQWLDRAPHGRNEAGPWWRRRDEY
jgi:predicted dithiol-disulfide oxidoreductase (DUF899 family)